MQDIILDRVKHKEAEDSLTSWKNPHKLTDLKADYNEALASHSGITTKIEEWLKSLRGTLSVETPKGRSKIQPKLIRKQAEWRYAALEEPFLSTEDLFDVNPVTHLDKEAAYQNQLVLNKQFRCDINKVKFINKFVRNAVDIGTVIIKVGWKVETGKVRQQVEQPIYASPEESMAIIQQQLVQGVITPEQAQQIIQNGEPVIIGTELVEEVVEAEIKNAPVLEIKDPRLIIIDPSCEGDLDNARFVIDRFTTDLATLKEDGKYKNLEFIVPSDESPLSQPDYITEDSSFSFKDKPRQKFVVYEYWGYWDIDGDGTVKPIVAAYVGDTLIRLEENPYPFKKPPFAIASYLPVTNSVYGEPDAELLKENQDIIGAITRGVIDLLGRSANSQLAIRKDALDLVNLEKFRKGQDFEFNPNVPVDQAFYMNKYPEIPRSAIEVIMMQNNEAEAITGVKAFSGGISGQALGDSVGGIRSALDATAKRELGILRRLSQCLIDIGKMIVAMNSVWLSDEEIIRITDDDFVAIKRDDLAGNFDLSLAVSTAEADNQKASELSFMLQTMGNSMPLDMTKIILSDIAKLRKMPKLAKQLEEYEPQPDPKAQEIQQLQIELLKAQIQNERNKAMENAVDVQLKEAKTQTELAKVRDLQTGSDIKDLDFVERSTGITQNRDLEKELFKQKFKVNK